MKKYQEFSLFWWEVGEGRVDVDDVLLVQMSKVHKSRNINQGT